MQEVSLVTVGDFYVGKTCLLITYATHLFPQEYVPTVFDVHQVDVLMEGKHVRLTLNDFAGGQECSFCFFPGICE